MSLETTSTGGDAAVNVLTATSLLLVASGSFPAAAPTPASRPASRAGYVGTGPNRAGTPKADPTSSSAPLTVVASAPASHATAAATSLPSLPRPATLRRAAAGSRSPLSAAAIP